MSKRMQVINEKRIEAFSQNISVQKKEQDTKNQDVLLEEQGVQITDRSPFHSPNCEFCGGQTKVYCYRPPVRYCKCSRCGWTFKK